MKIGIIGAGKVGCSMGKYMKEHGLAVAGYFSRRTESSEEAGTFTGTKAFEDLKSIIRACDILCIAVSDDAIKGVWSEMCAVSEREGASRLLENKIICHFSGSLSSDVFTGIENTGASACSVHPMSAFSDRFTSYRQLNHVRFTIEGQNKALQVMEGLISHMGNKVLKIQPEMKALYHCSASLVSNFMVGLFDMGLDLLERCGIDEKSGRELLGPLVEIMSALWLNKERQMP